MHAKKLGEIGLCPLWLCAVVPFFGCIAKIRSNEIRLTTSCANFVDGFLSALRAASYDQNMNTEVREFIGRRAANSAGSSGNECCWCVAWHVRIP